MTAPVRPRFAEIDLLKGCAILWVLLIHSKALGDGPLFRYVVNHAVPLFVIVFGLNARLWWRDRPLPGALATWYSTRVERILLPFWAALLVWWLLVLWFRPFGIELHWWLPLAHLGGYTISIGTGWFVTLILILALLYPAVEAAVRLLGVWPVLALALVGELHVAYAVTQLAPAGEAHGIPSLGFLVHPPRVLAHVVFGVVLADRMERLGLAAGALAAALFALCVAVELRWPVLEPYAQVLIDAPLAVTLLAGLRPLARVPIAGPALAWLGVSSWGIYLGQLLVHNAVVFGCGFVADLAPNLAACHFPFSRSPATTSLARWLYTGVLLVGAIGFVALGRVLLRAYRSARARG